MIKKLSCIHSLLKATKKYSTSKLYIPYDQTSGTYVAIEPYVDLENHVKNVKVLKDNIALRRLNIDVDKICDNWSSFVTVRDELVGLNDKKQKLTVQLKNISKDHVDDINRLKESRATVMIRLKTLREQISTIEKEVVIPSLNIPNRLHPDCPLSGAEILYQHSIKKNSNNINRLSHLEIGATLDCLDYTNSVLVYMKNELALCEQATLAYFNEYLEQLDFIPFCNSDLIRSVVLEGCGVNVDNADKTFILKDRDVHLVGGASLLSFCAFLTKQNIGQNKLPLRLFTVGRSYKPVNNNIGLFSAVQTNAVEFLIGTTVKCKAKEQFDEMLAVYKKLFTSFGLDYRIVYCPVFVLENWESLRAQVELYSVNCHDYVPVASLSLSEDYISKRLRIHWSGQDKTQQNFLNIVSGRLVDTNVLLACLLEQNVNEFVVPDCLKNYMIL